MRKWILLALLALLFFVTFKYREGVDSTLTPPDTDPTKYSDILKNVQDANNGPLPSAIDERASSGDTDTTRPLNGDVFGDNGPFSGQLGTGQGTGQGSGKETTPNTNERVKHQEKA